MRATTLITTFLLSGLLASCMRDAADPFSLAPATSYSSWTPLKGNQMISAKFCQTLIPPSFTDGEMNLAELIDVGLQNNPYTKQTWAQARLSAAQYGQSLSPFYPNVQFFSQYTRARGTFIQEGPPTPFYTTVAGPDVTLSYTLFDFGQRTAASLAAREALYVADWTHNQEIQIVMETVMRDYYDYLFQKELLRATEINLENASASLDAANQKFSLGLSTLGDVAQARTQYLQTKIQLTNQTQLTETSFAQLAVDLGLPANVNFKVQSMPDQIVTDPILDSIGDLITLAQNQRQDLLAAQANIRSKQALIQSAKRSVYPVLGTNLDFGKYWFQGGAEEDYHWVAEVSLSFPIFQGFYYKNGIKSAEANLEASQAKLVQTELSMIQHVTTSQMMVKTAAQNLKDTEEYLKAAELEFKISLSSYKAGAASILNVLSAQSAIADARARKAGSQKEWFTALASLAYATGSLCLPSNSECPL